LRCTLITAISKRLSWHFWLSFFGGGFFISIIICPAVNALSHTKHRDVHCDLLIVGSGIAGVASAYEALKAGRVVCLTDITDWVGGQITSEGVSALDEEPDLSHELDFPKGYLEFRQRIAEHYGTLNPGRCWVSEVCFFPQDGNHILLSMLQEAAKVGKGTLRWFPNTVIKSLKITAMKGQKSAQVIQEALGIEHKTTQSALPINTYPFSKTFIDSYSEHDSAQFYKTIVHFLPSTSEKWFIIEASETGELLALADVPYRIGIDRRTYQNPSASSETANPYCTQGFTYSFAIEATVAPQHYSIPPFYYRYAGYYSYGKKHLANLPYLFSYRRIWSANRKTPEIVITPGDISLQNWTWGNDYRPGTRRDNLIYTRQQLLETGQLKPSNWNGGLRISSLFQAEQLAQGYFYWLVSGVTDSRLGAGVKHAEPRLRYLKGLNSPMGTVNGLSKYPYIREGRRLIGRPSQGYPQGFSIDEIDISRQDFEQPFYQQSLTPRAYQDLKRSLKQSGKTRIQRTQSTRYLDSVGIGHYPIDIHPCMALSPPERSGNYEYSGETQARSDTSPFQIPLRSMIPQRINNLLVTGKNIATSHISAAAYRTQPFEWSVGSAAGTTAAFALEKNIWPYQLVETVPLDNPSMRALQLRLRANGNPIDFLEYPFILPWGLGLISTGGLILLLLKLLQVGRKLNV
jgi:FAD dependent oxidoreductase